MSKIKIIFKTFEISKSHKLFTNLDIEVDLENLSKEISNVKELLGRFLEYQIEYITVIYKQNKETENLKQNFNVIREEYINYYLSKIERELMNKEYNLVEFTLTNLGNISINYSFNSTYPKYSEVLIDSPISNINNFHNKVINKLKNATYRLSVETQNDIIPQERLI
ncbi:MAG: hypothetical protein J0H68_01845 [Sphingobacteriia bacterium]|nr:hypothetical protein [Sphingobacteriia bacterium]